MPYGECKIYNDSSHYIAIPYKPSKAKRRPKPPEELVTVVDDPIREQEENTATEIDRDPLIPVSCGQEGSEEVVCEQEPEIIDLPDKLPACAPKPQRKATRKELFEQFYEETKDMKRSQRKKLIITKMRPYFPNKVETENYVQAQFERKLRNLICRRVRLARKVNLANFNYFCTFTYDGTKHTEESFKKKLQGCFKMMCHRKGWKYAGVWERSPKKHRLHFHGLFEIPEGSMPGEIIKVKDYSPFKKRVQVTYQSTYFNERFGRSDFSEIDSKALLGEAIAYLTKYMEKTGEKIVYSKNLPQFFISDIMDEDIVCTIGQEDRKLLLFDDFGCWDEGCYMGTVSPEVIKQMRKTN